MNIKVRNANTCRLCVWSTFHGNASHTLTYLCATSLHGLCACLYVCDCVILRVRLYGNVRMMSWWGTQDHIQLVTECHPTWWRLYQFMLVEIPGEVPEGSDADTCRGSGGFRCRCLFSFWKVPVQIHVEVPGPGSFTIVQRHCMLVCVWLYLYDCMCSMAMCPWCHRENHMTTRVSNSIQSNMTASVWIHLFDDSVARSHAVKKRNKA